MSLFLDVFLRGEFLFDALGVIGLGLVAMAAIRLSRRYHSWGGSLIACGALMLLAGRLWALVSAQMKAMAVGESLGVIAQFAPLTLLTAGLAAIVWGLWGHDQWLRADR